MHRPDKHLGLHHLALNIKNFEACLIFYKDLLGMQIEWQPDENNIYLSSGTDNLALHRKAEKEKNTSPQALDHLGFILKTLKEVDDWFDFLKSNNVIIKTRPRTHRDGAKSFYCEDPDGNVIQMIYHPPLSKKLIF